MARTETTRDTAADVRALVHAKRPKAWAQGYPAAVRDRVCAYVAERRGVGATVGRVAAELGLSRHSVLAWTEARQTRGHLRPFVLHATGLPAPPPARSGLPPPPAPALPHG
jgi:transposase-like protein